MCLTLTSSALTGFVATTFLAGAEDWKDRRACNKGRGNRFPSIELVGDNEQKHGMKEARWY
jgi:hypothetical protein